MSDHAVSVNDGAGVKLIMNTLNYQYYVQQKILKVCDYGDSSQRERLFIIGFLKCLGRNASQFTFPKQLFNEVLFHSARDIALPDELIPNEYWRKDNTTLRYQSNSNPTPGQAHKLAFAGKGMGPSYNPNQVTS